MNILHRIWAWVDHNPWKAGGAVLAALLLGGALIGCRAETASLANPGTTVPRPAYNVEVVEVGAVLRQEAAALEIKTDAFLQRVEMGYDDLEAQEARIQQILDLLGSTLTTLAAGGTLNPAGLIVPGLGILGMFFGVTAVKDKKKADQVILDLKNGK